MFAELIINRNLPRQFDTLTYRIPGEISVAPGQTVIAPFRNKRITGIITGISNKKPDYNVKDILGILGEEILLQEWQISLAKWISEYYLCPLSKVIPLFLPKKIWNLQELNTKFVRYEGRKKEKPDGKTKEIFNKDLERVLTQKQKEALEKILENPTGTFLLHGITGSGKTEVYLRLAKDALEKGNQALFLVPEIALTPQLIDFIKNRFYEMPITVIHSKLTERERNQGWLDIYSGKTRIVIGSRSAIFSPFKNLGLIIMDEEHEWTYKQEQMPRYHTRKVAEKIAELAGVSLVMGSATPDTETYATAVSAKRILELPGRISETPMPQTSVIDMREEIRKKNFSIFSEVLTEKLAQALGQKKQVILFLNRRGMASATLCRDCGFVSRCEECQVALVTHRAENGFLLICHHCGKRVLPPEICPECESHYIKGIGIGTEKVEDEIKKLFSLARVMRADSDTIQKKSDYQELYEKLKNHEVDILVGTQMIAKGLDLPQVHFVGVILADTSLHFPDFRASERTFQLLTQVSGRAGRRKDQGEVIIQTYNPEHYAIRAAAAHDYKMFYETEMEVRKKLEYPPFSKIIRLHYAHKDPDACKKAVQEMESKLTEKIKQARNAAGNNTPVKIASFPSIIPKLHGKYHHEIILKGKTPESMLENLALEDTWSIDVDPL